MSQVEHVHPSGTVHPKSLFVVVGVPEDTHRAVADTGESWWEEGGRVAAGPGCEFSGEDVYFY